MAEKVNWELLKLQLSEGPEEFFPGFAFPKPPNGEVDWKRLKWQLSADPINECVDLQRKTWK